MKFVDEASITVRSGDGGKGAVHFRRAKYQPKLGPDGGDGGKGGSVWFEATHDLQSLLDFKFQPRYEAQNGQPGQGNDCNGKGGEDLVVRVPVGTVLKHSETGHVIADLVSPNERILIAKGGRGGLGNMNFATPTRQAPDFAQPGEPGEEVPLRMELKLLADVGLVGFPNAGKSTLISRLSSARPKIADYPFTTLIPNLGVVRGKSRDFVLADIPGIIEGASEGRGLGTRFLKHCERTEVLVLVLDADPTNERSLVEEFEILTSELKLFSEELWAKKKVVLVNKMDVFGDGALPELLNQGLEDKGFSSLVQSLENSGMDFPMVSSAVSGRGLPELTAVLEQILNHKDSAPKPKPASVVVEDLSFGDPNLFL